MFSKEAIEISEELQRSWKERRAQMYKGFEFEGTTDSEIPLKTVYSPQDIDSINFKEIGMPGEYPYTRGVYPLQYQYQPLMAQQGFGYGLPENTRERYEYLRAEGMTGYRGMEAPYNVSPDIPGIVGLDPDDPEARGWVGWSGPSISTIRDFEILFDGLPLDRTHIAFFGVSDPSIVFMALLCAYLEKRGIPLEKMNGNVNNCFIAQNTYYDQPHLEGEGALKVATELVKFCSKRMPRWGTLNCHGYSIEESGGTAAQEVAFVISCAIELTRACIKVGLDPDVFVPRFSMQLACGRDFFEQIAKIRAARRIWAKIFKERFGCKNPKALQLRIHIQTAGAAMTYQQPLNNALRACLFTLSAILGGVQAVWTTTYDEAYSLPCEEAQILALRTRQIIMEESNIPNVTDPLGGSYYMEWLTSKVEEETFELIDEIERMGGFVKCWGTGWLKGEIDRAYRKWKESIEKGEKTLVGVNKYVIPEEKRPIKFSMDPKWEEMAIERIKDFKAKRDNEEVKRALEELRIVSQKVNEEWPSGGDLMPALIDAAKANATLGEMSKILKTEFGWRFTY
jgi:methylmalonyl-CoA mutase N-terminal domain/subunit